MQSTWLPVTSSVQAGKTLALDKQEFWEQSFVEHCLDYRIIEPVRASIFVQAYEEGILFRGTLTGKVLLPCDRCCAEAEVVLQHSFDTYEPYPEPESSPAPQAAASNTTDEQSVECDETIVRRNAHGNGIEINPWALAWQEFVLALPVKPLCTETCKGLCPACGSNKNTSSCSCAVQEGDPRMAALQGLVIKK